MPAPEVLWIVRFDAAPEPPLISGLVRLVEPDSVVNDPAAAAVPPIAGGEARYVLKPVPLTVEDADSVVKLPAAAAVPPIAGGDAKYVLKPVPLTVEDAESVVNAPVLAVVAPIEQLLIVPAVAGLIVTTPVPVGDMTTLRLAGLRATAPLAVSVVKVPARAVVAPITT